jgi:Pentapeptide repeats (8 copies)
MPGYQKLRGQKSEEHVMANPEHRQILAQGVGAWNTWRSQEKDIRPDLRDTNLRGVHFHAANLTGADLLEATLLGHVRDTGLGQIRHQHVSRTCPVRSHGRIRVLIMPRMFMAFIPCFYFDDGMHPGMDTALKIMCPWGST